MGIGAPRQNRRPETGRGTPPEPMRYGMGRKVGHPIYRTEMRNHTS